MGDDGRKDKEIRRNEEKYKTMREQKFREGTKKEGRGIRDKEEKKL